LLFFTQIHALLNNILIKPAILGFRMETTENQELSAAVHQSAIASLPTRTYQIEFRKIPYAI